FFRERMTKVFSMAHAGMVAMCMGDKSPSHGKPGINVYISRGTVYSFGSEFNHIGSTFPHITRMTCACLAKKAAFGTNLLLVPLNSRHEAIRLAQPRRCYRR